MLALEGSPLFLRQRLPSAYVSCLGALQRVARRPTARGSFHRQRCCASPLTDPHVRVCLCVCRCQDLEEFRDELDDDEYEETKEETMEQMKEFEAALKEHMEGNMSLVDELGSVQLAIQAAIKKAFQTPEVIRLFAKGEHEGLRIRLGNIKRDNRLGKLDDDSYKSEAVEIILALKKLAVELTPEERHFLASASDVASKFESADKELGEGILSAAASGVRSAAT